MYHIYSRNLLTVLHTERRNRSVGEFYICAEHQLYVHFLNAFLEWGNAFRSFRWNFLSESYRKGTTFEFVDVVYLKNKRRLFILVKFLSRDKFHSFESCAHKAAFRSYLNCISVKQTICRNKSEITRFLTMIDASFYCIEVFFSVTSIFIDIFFFLRMDRRIVKSIVGCLLKSLLMHEVV